MHLAVRLCTSDDFITDAWMPMKQLKCFYKSVEMYLEEQFGKAGHYYIKQDMLHIASDWSQTFSLCPNQRLCPAL